MIKFEYDRLIKLMFVLLFTISGNKMFKIDQIKKTDLEESVFSKR